MGTESGVRGHVLHRWLVPEAGIPDSLQQLRLIHWPEYPKAAGVLISRSFVSRLLLVRCMLDRIGNPFPE